MVSAPNGGLVATIISTKSAATNRSIFTTVIGFTMSERLTAPDFKITDLHQMFIVEPQSDIVALPID
jgi:hypothetical protein